MASEWLAEEPSLFSLYLNSWIVLGSFPALWHLSMGSYRGQSTSSPQPNKLRNGHKGLHIFCSEDEQSRTCWLAAFRLFKVRPLGWPRGWPCLTGMAQLCLGGHRSPAVSGYLPGRAGSALLRRSPFPRLS